MNMPDSTPGMSEPGLLPNLPPEPSNGTPFDMTTLMPEDVPIVPDHTASGGTPPIPPEETGRRKRRLKRNKTPKATPPKQRPGALVKPLTDIYTTIGLAVVPFDPVCGMSIADNARKCAESLDALARENDAVRRAITALVQTGAWGGVMAAHLPLLLVITAHHAPRDVADRVAPLAAMMNPNSVKAAQEAQRAAEAAGESAA